MATKNEAMKRAAAIILAAAVLAAITAAGPPAPRGDRPCASCPQAALLFF